MAKEYEYNGYTLKKIETKFNPIYQIVRPDGSEVHYLYNIERAKMYINNEIALGGPTEVTDAF